MPRGVEQRNVFVQKIQKHQSSKEQIEDGDLLENDKVLNVQGNIIFNVLRMMHW